MALHETPRGGERPHPDAGRSPLHAVGRRAAADLALSVADISRIAPPAGLPGWRSALRVGELAHDSVALSSLAIALIGETRGGRAVPDGAIRVEAPRIEASFGSERLFRLDGEAPAVWAGLSGFWRVADGWVRTHGNYPHHAERLARLIGVAVSAPRTEVEASLARWNRLELEERAAGADALAVAVRDAEEWREHPQARALADAPLIGFRGHGRAGPRPWRGDPSLPLAGIRVLDLTRVIAGPVAARDLALAGADVLRVDSPRLPESPWQHLDTGQGKRSTLLDLGDRTHRREFERLLEAADVVVHGYRPAALARFGLDAEVLHERHPGLVVAQLSAWGTEGPWGRRRGFDSLVQAASGIAMRESRDGGETPGALPVQALDHSAGHFLAASVAAALRAQRTTGGSFAISLSLARIADALLAAGPAPQRVDSSDPHDPPTVSVPLETAPGTGAAPSVVTCAPPVLAFPGAPSQYASPLHAWGADEPRWE
jgi:crotonobetainyl-CoA:carnitine CoA-transferase CaiB-like acyl-CoA transferase